MKCPVCKEATLTMAERQGVEIDYCPGCRGVWLEIAGSWTRSLRSLLPMMLAVLQRVLRPQRGSLNRAAIHSSRGMTKAIITAKRSGGTICSTLTELLGTHPDLFAPSLGDSRRSESFNFPRWLWLKSDTKPNIMARPLTL